MDRYLETDSIRNVSSFNHRAENVLECELTRKRKKKGGFAALIALLLAKVSINMFVGSFGTGRTVELLVGWCWLDAFTVGQMLSVRSLLGTIT